MGFVILIGFPLTIANCFGINFHMEEVKAMTHSKPIKNEKEIDDIKKEKKKWEETIKSKSKSRTGVAFETISGMPLDMLYTPCDVVNLNYEKTLVFQESTPSQEV